MAADPPRREHKPLVERVDALLRRHQEAQRLAEAEVPLLTEVAESTPGGAPSLDGQALEALSLALEQAVLDRLGPDLDRAVEAHLQRALHAALQAALNAALTAATADVSRALHEDLSASVRALTREAVADALARALGRPAPGPAAAVADAGAPDDPIGSAQR